MNEKIVKEFVVLQKASPVVSFIEDVFSFGGFIALLWFNHRYLSGNGWLDVLFVFGWIMVMAGGQSRRYHKFKTPDEAIKWLEGEKNEQK